MGEAIAVIINSYLLDIFEIDRLLTGKREGGVKSFKKFNTVTERHLFDPLPLLRVVAQKIFRGE